MQHVGAQGEKNAVWRCGEWGGERLGMGQLDPCHYNFLKLDFMLKSMPLSGMIFNVKPKFTELWWHESNFPLIQRVLR